MADIRSDGASPLSASGAEANTVRAAFAGLLVGVDSLSRTIALTAFIFAGALSAGVPFAIGLYLFTNLISTAICFAGRALPVPLFAGVQHAPVAVLFPTIVMLGQAGQTVSVFVLLGITAILSGAAMVLVGVFDLARFVRLIPYPVAAGFLAGVGAILVRSSLELVYEHDLSQLFTHMITGDPQALLVGLAIVFAIALGVAGWALRNTGVILVLALGLIGTFAVLHLMGIPLDRARDIGLLHQPVGTLAIPTAQEISAGFAGLAMLNLSDVLPLIGAAVMISLFGVMLNSTGAELVLNRDVDSSTSLIRSGIANMLTGAMGSTVSYLSASNTTTAQRLSSDGRLPVLVMIGFLALTLPFARPLFELVPSFVAAGLVIYIGASIVQAWLIDQFRRISRVEWCLCLLIVLVSLSFGMVTAVGLGVLAASVIFAVTYARLPVVHRTGDLSTRRSTIDRGPAQTAHLDETGHKVGVVSLQGFVFFGTATQLSNQVRAVLDDPSAPHTVILDFSRVSRLDTSAIATLKRLELLARDADAQLIFTGMNDETQHALTHSGLDFGPDAVLQIVAGVDDAIEQAEEGLITGLDAKDRDETACSALARINGSVLASRMLKLMEREEIEAGHLLIRQGDPAGDVFLVDQGRLSVRLNLPDGRSIRLRTFAEGALVGEVASYAGLARTADVVAQTDVVLYRLSVKQLSKLQKEDPQLAAALHYTVAVTLADRLDRTNKLLG